LDEKRFEELFPEPETVERQRKHHARTFFKHWAQQLSPKTPWDFAQIIEIPVKRPHKKMLSFYITMGSTVAACFIIAVILPSLSTLLHMSEHTDTAIVTEIEKDDEQNAGGYDYNSEESSSVDNRDDREESENTVVDSESDHLTDKEELFENTEDKNHGGKGQEKKESNQQKESEKNGKKQGENKKQEEKQELSHQEENEKNEKEQKSDRKEENKNKGKPGKEQSKTAHSKDNNPLKNKNVQPENTEDKTPADNDNSVGENDFPAENIQETENINNSAPITDSPDADDSAHPDFGDKNDAIDDSAFENATGAVMDTTDIPPDMSSDTTCDDSLDCDSSPANTDASTDIDEVMEDICVDDCIEVPLKKDVTAYAYLHLEETWYIKKGMLKPWGEEIEYSYLGEGFLSEERDSSYTKAVTVLGEEKNAFVVYVEFQDQDENAYFYYERMEE